MYIFINPVPETCKYYIIWIFSIYLSIILSRLNGINNNNNKIESLKVIKETDVNTYNLKRK